QRAFSLRNRTSGELKLRIRGLSRGTKPVTLPPRLRMLLASARRGSQLSGAGRDPNLSRGYWALESARGSGAACGRVGKGARHHVIPHLLRCSHGERQSRQAITDGGTPYDPNGGLGSGDARPYGARQWRPLEGEERVNMKVPRDMDDAKALGKVLSKYKDTFYVQCSGLGASFCYMLSYLVGRPVVYKYLTEKAVKWSQQVERHREHLINYIIFLRITPFLPNWFINITSPVINVPLKVFFIGTFLGVAPPSFVAIKAGTTLYQLTTAGEAVSWNSVFVLMILALLSILPAIFQKKLKQKFE
ncbi:Transmembrane protein 41B, partial [Galemys pyrenaicus]